MMQLTLNLDGDVQPRPLLRTPAQEASFQNLLAILRAETQQILDAAITLSGQSFSSLVEVPTPLLASAREMVFGKTSTTSPSIVLTPRKTREYRPWALKAKYGLRCRRLMERVRKRTSLWFFEELQTQVLTNPEYFGVCPLPSETVCHCNPGKRLRWLQTEAEKQHEQELRARSAL